MASSDFIHLSDEQLAQFEDGELPRREAGHIASCRECQDRLHDLRTGLAAYAEYRDSIRGPSLPPAPKPWFGLHILIQQHREAKTVKRFRWWPVPVLAAAVSLAMAVVVLYQVLPNQKGVEPSVRTTELLAQSAGMQRPEGRLISLRVRGQTLIRPAVLTSSSQTEDQSGLADVESAFVSAHYSWREPLSARSFQAWRAGLRKKKDYVTVIHGQDNRESYRVGTDSFSGALRRASLTLRAQDLRPTEGSFEFTTLGTVELSDAPIPSQGAVLPRAAPESRARPVPHSEILAGPEDTLHVLAALDRIGADVGEPIDVTVDEQRHHVVVRSSGLTPQRQQELADALRPLPRVILDFASGGSMPMPPTRPTTPETYSTSIPEPLRKQLEARFGGAPAQQETTDRVLEASALVLARVHALSVLAEEFPPETEAHLSTQDRALLRGLRDSHVAELGSLVASIRAGLKPLLTPSSGATRPNVTTDAPRQSWQIGVPALVASAQETDKVLNRLLAGSYSERSGEEMLNGLTSQIDRLQSAMQLEQRHGR